jgi:endonuclease I/phosphodiesterase/alkaline phosphatase D-like protein
MKLFLIYLLLLTNLTIFAAIPAGYYDPATGLSGEDLQTALYNIINGHSSISYDNLWYAFSNTDRDYYYENDGTILDMYSENPTGADPYTHTYSSDQCGSYVDEGDCYNREHSFPKSWFNDTSPMSSDLFHLVPTDGKVNGMRDNYPFGEVSSPTWTSLNGSKRGPCSYPGYTGTVFEPIDEFKGDFARTYFYMATRYSNVIAGWENNDSNGDAVLNGTSYPAYETWFVNMLLEWHTNDPVSQKEIDRNDTIYSSYQHNRNPFIDHPEYAGYIWGGETPSLGTPVATSATNITSTSFTANWNTANGATGYRIDVSTNSSFLSFVSGYNNVNVNNVTTYSVSGLNPETGYFYRVRAYDSSETSSNSNTISVTTNAPLSTPTATNASNVASTSFSANWNSVSGATGYEIDVATDTGFNNFVGSYNDLDIGNVTTYSVSGLNPETDYYYRVRAYDTAETSTNSNTISLTTSEASSGGGLETFANMPETGSSYLTGTFLGQDGSIWNYIKSRSDVDITGNAIMLGRSQTPQSTFYSGTITGGVGTISFDYMQAYSTNVNLNLLINDTVVGNVTTSSEENVIKNSGNITVNVSGNFVIKFINVNNSDGQVVVDNITWTSYSSGSAPSAPVASSATDITATSFTANWEASSGATSYRLDVATDSGFSSMLGSYNDVTVSSTSQSVTGLSASTDYYYRVRAINSYGNSGNSNTINATTSSGIPSAPISTSATGITTNSFTANWEASSGATSYRLDVALDVAFTSILGSYNNLSVSSTTQSVTGLTASTDYYYRVRAVNTYGTSGNSDIISLTTSTESSGEAAVILSELCDPTSDYAVNRFIEICNVGGASQDLTGWSVVAVGNNSNIFTWTLSGTINPGQALVCGDDGAFGFTVNFIESNWSSSNSTWNGKVGDGARLNDGSKAIVDQIIATGTLFENQTLTRNANIVEPTGISDESEWSSTPVTNASDASPGSHETENPLPVTLSSFTAVYHNYAAKLNWVTQTELNNSHWNVYRSISENIGQSQKMNSDIIEGSGTTFIPTEYEFVDQSIEMENDTYYYWIESVSLSGATELHGCIELAINNQNDNPEAPEVVEMYGLYQNYPNPFNPETSISFKLPEAGTAIVSIYSIKGQKISELFNGTVEADKTYSLLWDAKDDKGNPLPSGIYFYNLDSGSANQNRKMLLIK